MIMLMNILLIVIFSLDYIVEHVKICLTGY